jgi:hypothetical protein
MAITNIPDDLVSNAQNSIDYVSSLIKQLKNCCPSKEQVVESIKFFKDNWSSILVISVFVLTTILVYKLILSSAEWLNNKLNKKNSINNGDEINGKEKDNVNETEINLNNTLKQNVKNENDRSNETKNNLNNNRSKENSSNQNVYQDTPNFPAYPIKSPLAVRLSEVANCN